MEQLTDKVVVITGAKGGLGSFVTRAFLEAGATVAGVSRSIAAADFDHPRFQAVPAELSSRASADGVIGRVAATSGRIDAVVHLMGGWAGGARVEALDEAAFDRMLSLNFKSAYFMLSAALPGMRKQGAGRLLAVASRAAVDPAPNSAAYNASKAAMVSLVRTIALETRGSGITANTVLPGTMDTPQNRAAMPFADPAGWVPPAQVASLLVYLASNAGASISGAALPVYGAEF